MEYLFKALSNPLGTNFPEMTSALVKIQISIFFKQYNNFAEANNTHTFDITFDNHHDFLTHSTEVFPFIYAKMNQIDLRMHKKWYELGANILAYVIGQIESINVKYQGDTLPIRIFGKTYFDPIHIIGENGILKVITISNKVKTYKLVNLKELGIRWVDKDKLTSFWDTNDELPFFIASGYIEENNNKPNNICNKHSEFELQIKNALSFLASNFEEYYLWIILNLKELSPLQKPAHCQTQSQTSLALPGHIEINNQASLIEVINMLVHECSHLYFHLLQLSHPLCTHDAPMCYSILKERERPLINVLLGFHAFANVLILLTKIKIAKLAEIVVEELDEHLKHVLNYVLSLDKELSNHIKYLRENTGLVIYYTLKSMLIEQGYFT